jgi:hypothetical protein
MSRHHFPPLAKGGPGGVGRTYCNGSSCAVGVGRTDCNGSSCAVGVGRTYCNSSASGWER